MLFKDRADAGKKLAQMLEKYKGKNAIVLALPRGGVIVAAEVAKFLALPLDAIITKKIGAPGNPEYAVGAISEGGEIIKSWLEKEISEDYLKSEAKNLKNEISRRIKLYRENRDLPDLKNKIVILVDDGIATGLSIEAALQEIKKRHPSKIILAIPVAAPDVVDHFQKEVSELVILATPDPFWAVGRFYEEFGEVSDEEVIAALSEQEPLG